MALNEWGYRRVTIDVDILLSPEGLRALVAAVMGRGYTERFPGRRGLRDTETGINVDVVLAGEYPGDGRPKPVVFPDPAQAAVRSHRVALLPLPKQIELKLASGISAPHRLKDLADVLELIRQFSLPARWPSPWMPRCGPSTRSSGRLPRPRKGSDPQSLEPEVRAS